MNASCVVSIVTFNSAQVIGACLQSIPSHLPVHVVDNGSRDDTCAIIHHIRPDAVITRARNIGFGRAHNHVFNRTTSDFVLVLNPDTVLLPHCMDELLAAAGRYPDSGLIGALHQNEHGTPNACFRNDVHCDVRLARYPMRAKAGHAWPVGDICVEQMTGALMLLRRSALVATGGFNKRLFMYFEDDDLCARLRRAGFALIVAAHARVVHLEGLSAGSSARVNCIKGYHFERSRKIIYRIYHGTGIGYRLMLATQIWQCMRRSFMFLCKGQRHRALYYAAGLKALVSKA